MKKFSLVLAVLAVFLIAVFSFTKKSETKTAFVTYVWIKYNCGSFGSATVSTVTTGTNTQITSDPNFPTSWGNPHFQRCFLSGNGICAIRFLQSEIEPIPGMSGQAQPKAGVNPWDGTHMIAYCN